MRAWHTRVAGDVAGARRRDAMRGVLTALPAVGQLAVSDRWLVLPETGRLLGTPDWRRPQGQLSIQSREGGQVGRPALNGDTVVYSVTGGGSAIAAVDIRRRHARVIRRTPPASSSNPRCSPGTC